MPDIHVHLQGQEVGPTEIEQVVHLGAQLLQQLQQDPAQLDSREPAAGVLGHQERGGALARPAQGLGRDVRQVFLLCCAGGESGPGGGTRHPGLREGEGTRGQGQAGQAPQGRGEAQAGRPREAEAGRGKTQEITRGGIEEEVNAEEGLIGTQEAHA